MDKNVPGESVEGSLAPESETKAQLTAIIDNADGFIYSIDRNFRLIAFNEISKTTALQIFGLRLEPGSSPLDFFDIINPSLVKEWKAICLRALSGEKIHFVREFDFAEKIFWEFSFNPIRQGEEITGIACFARDITVQKLNELKLRESEERYRLLYENPMLGVVWGTIQGIVTNANQAFFDLLEGTPEEVINLHFSEFTHPDDLKAELPLYKQLVKGKINSYRIEKRYITKKKNIKWVEANISSLKDASGKFRGGIGIIQDISEKKEAQESLRTSEANMRYILDHSDTACLLLDREFNVLTANRLANDWARFELGITLGEGVNFLSHFPELYKTIGAEVMQKVLQGTLYSYEAKYTKRDKSVSWYHVRLAPIENNQGEVIGLSIVANDTTHRKNAEMEIKSLNDSLEKKVKDRTAELEEANKELEAFTYSISHDLLSPLRNIDSFADILVEDYRNILNDEGQHALGVIKRNASLMGHLISDLLDFARLGRVPLVKQLVSMDGVVLEVIDELRFMTNKLAAKINLKELYPAHCDPQLVKQVWVNLLSNAVKYSSTEPNPEIEIGAEEKNGQIVYYIRDNGVGFDMQFADKLFGVFHRLHKSSEFEGTGVGLAIVHRIVTKHGGQIWAEAKVGEGAVFYFTL